MREKIRVEAQEVRPFYPSSQWCSCCGQKKHHLTLKDRT